MRQSFHKRLGRLETISFIARQASEYSASQSGPSAADTLRETLRLHGFEPGPKESWAETFARALGVNSSQLDEILRSGSCGQ
jgi:hypothetical protein